MALIARRVRRLLLLVCLALSSAGCLSSGIEFVTSELNSTGCRGSKPFTGAPAAARGSTLDARQDRSPEITSDEAFQRTVAGRFLDPDGAGYGWTPVLSEGVLVTANSEASRDGDLGMEIIGADARTGKRIWRRWVTGLDGPIGGSGLFFYSDDLGTDEEADVFVRHLYGANLKTGKVIWRVPIGTEGERTVTYAQGTVYVGSVSDDDLISGEVFAVDARSGRLKWKYRATNAVEGGVAAAEGIAVFGSSNGCLYGLDETTGKERWRYDTEGEIVSTPLVTSGTVYAGNTAGRIYAVDMGTGRLQWDRRAKNAIYHDLAASGRRIFAYSWIDKDDEIAGTIESFDAESGKMLWRRTEAGADAPVIAKTGRLYYHDFTSDEPKLGALDPASGRAVERGRPRVVTSVPDEPESLYYIEASNIYRVGPVTH